jgi:hypothetical protein
MIVQARVISLIKQQQTICQNTSEKSTNNVSNQLKINENKRHFNYNLVKNSIHKKSSTHTSMEDEVKDYIRFISDENFECACPL